MPIDKIVARLFTKDLWPRPAVVLIAASIFAFWGMAIFIASKMDGTIEIPPLGKGLRVHYGFQAAFLSGPLVLLTTYYSVAIFLQISRDIDGLIAPGMDPQLPRILFKYQIASLLMRSRWQTMLWLLIVIGTSVSILIFRNLDDPIKYWGNDVFNASAYRYGYYAANSYLLLLWGIIYPIGVFYAAHLTISSELIVSKLMARGMLKLNFLHIDRCGGMARFGMLNIFVMLIYFWPFFAAFALHVTHNYTYLSLVLGGMAISIALLLQSLYGIYWVARVIRSQREAAIVDLNKRIADSMDDNRSNYTAAMANMEFRDRVLSVSEYPYAGPALALVNILRFAPAAIAAAKALS